MPSIDERVVQMKFDNKQFESDVATSERTLERFKNKSLDFSGVKDSLNNLERSFSGLDFSGLESSIDRLTERFSPLGILGVEAMERIANAALDAGKKVADAFFGISDMSAGQNKYETRTRAVQTIMNATGKSVEEVEAVLDHLQYYTDQTSYDFANMVDNIGKFTAAGVDLEMAEKAMEGIANEAAKSGANAQQASHAMYNFAQSLSTGSVKLQDWKSISNATMATKEFKEVLIDTAIEIGTLQSKGENVGSIVTVNEKQLAAGQKALKKAQSATKDQAEKVAEAQAKIAAATKETEVNYKSFDTTLSEGWLTSDVLIAALNKYSDMETDFGREAYYAAQRALTFTDAIQATKDAISSGWMDSFGYIFGNLEEAIKLWTGVADALSEYVGIFAKWRNTILAAWHEQGGYNDMIEAASNLWQVFMNIVRGVGQALTDVFPILNTTNMTEALKNGTAYLKEASAELLDMFGLYQEVKEEEEDVAKEAKKIEKETDKIDENTKDLTDNMSDLGDETERVNQNVDGIKSGLERGMKGDDVKELQERLIALGFRLDKFGADGIFGPETQAAVKALQREIGVTETGMLDAATMAALNTEEALAKLQARAHKGLGRGDIGADVKDLQRDLNRYLSDGEKLVVDGIMGPKTEARLKELQKELGVKQTGVWDDATRAAVKSGKMILFSLDKLRKGVKLGDVGNEVKSLQEQLIKSGYLTDQSVADGIFGPKTEAALKALQKELGVEETGVWDQATMMAVNRAKRMQKANSEAAKAAAETSESVDEAGEEAEEAAEKADKASNRTTIAMMRLKNVAGGIGAALKIAGNMAGSFVKIGWNILSMFDPLIDVGVRFGSVFGVMFQNLAKELDENNSYEKFVEKVTTLFSPLSNLINSVSTALTGLLNVYDSYLESTGKDNTFENFFSFLDSYLEKAGPFGKVLGSVIDLIRSLVSIISGAISIVVKVGSVAFEVGKRIMTTLSPLWNMLSTIFQAGVKLFEAFTEKFLGVQHKITDSSVFTDWLTKLDEILPSVQEKIQVFCDRVLEFFGLADGVNTIDFSKKIDDMVAAVKKLFGIGIDNSDIADNIDPKSAVETIKGKITSIFNGIKDWILGLFKKDDIAVVKDGVFKLDGYKISLGVIGVAVALIAKQLFSVTNTFIKIGKDVREVIDNVTGITKELKIAKKLSNMDAVATAILKFAGAIAILAASVYVLAQLGWNKLLVGLTGLVVIVGVLIGGVFALTKVMKDAKGIDKSIASLLSLGIAIGALAASVVALGALDLASLAKGLIGTAVLLGMCVLFFKVMNKTPVNVKETSGTIGLLISLGTALNMLTSVVSILGKMDLKQMIQGLGGILALMTGIAVFCKILNGTKIGVGAVFALITAAVAIDLLIAGFLVLTLAMKHLTGTDILKGLAGMGIIVLGMVGLLKLIENIHPSIGSIFALLPAAIALDLLVLGFGAMILVMKHAKLEDVLKAFGGITVLVLGVAALLKLIENIHPSIGSIFALLPAAIALDLLVLGFGAMMLIMKRSTTKDILKAIVGVGAIIVSVGLLMKMMEKVKPSIGSILALIPVALALDVLIAGFVVLALVMKSVGTAALIKAMVSLGAIVIAMGVLCSSIAKVNNGTQGIKAAFTIIPLVIAMAGLAITFSLFAKSMKGVSTKTLIKSIVALGSMVLSVGLLSKTSSKMNVKSILGILTSGAVIALLMYTFSKALERIKGMDASTILSFATGLSEIFVAFAIVGAIAGKLGGGFGAFTGIIAVAAGIAVVLAAFSAILQIPGVDEFLGGGAEKLGAIIGRFTGAMKAAEIEAFNKATEKLQSIGSVDQGKVDNAIAAAQAIADFGAGLPRKDLITKAADFFFGSELTQFSRDMSNFGIGFNSYAKAINEITDFEGLDTKTASAIAIANSIKAFGESFEEKSIDQQIADAIFGSELSQFSSDMVNFGIGFNSYAKAINEITDFEGLDTKTASAIAIANSIKAFGESFEEKSIDQQIADAIFGSELSQFSSDMSDFGIGFKSYAKIIQSMEDTDGLDEKTKSAIGIANSIKDFSDSLTEKSISETIVESIFGSELSQFSSDLVDFSTGFNSFASIMGNITELDDASSLESKTASAVAIADSIRTFSEKLSEKTTEETIVDSLFGSELSQFSGDLVDFSVGFNSFAAIMGKITELEDPTSLENKTASAIAIAESINSFAQTLTEKTTEESIVDSIFGSELKQFDGDMTDFASTFNTYASTMGGITASKELVSTNTETAISIATDIAEFLEKVSGMDIENKAKGIKGWFSDETNGETVIRTVGELANSISDSKDQFAGISEGSLVEDVKASVRALTSVAGLMNALTTMELGRDDLDSSFRDKITYVTGGLSQIGTSVQQFNTSLGDIDIASTATIMSSISDFMKFLGTNTGTDDLGEGLPDLSGIMTKITTALTGDTAEAEYSSAGQKIFSSIISGLSSGDISPVNDFVTAVYTAVTDRTEDFQTAGENFANGLANGVYFKAYIAVEQATYMAQQMVNAVKNIFAVASPSKVMNQVGRYFSIGLAQGTEKEGVTAVKSSKDVAENMVNAAKNSLGSLSRLLEEDIDADPVIRPVVDMSDIERAKVIIGQGFGSGSVGVDVGRVSRQNANAVSDLVKRGNGGTLGGGYQGSRSEVNMSDIRDTGNFPSIMTQKLEDLVNRVSNMRVVMENGALVGQIAGGIDERLGEMYELNGRRG